MKDISILFYDNDVLSLLHDPLFPSGGAAKQIMAWTQGLMKIDVDVKIMGAHTEPGYFNNKPDIIVSYKQDKGIRIVRYIYIRIPGIIKGIIKSRATYIYYGVPGHIAGLLGLISRILRKKYILRISNDYLVDERYKKNKDIFRYYFYTLGFTFADYILCQNKYQYERIRIKYPNKTHLLVNPYSGEIHRNILPFDKRKYISWVGIVQYKKNLPLLLKIAKALPDIRFIIAGNVSSKADTKCKLALDELRQLPNVLFLGFIKCEDVLRLLRESFVLLNTSHYEGFSNTYLEAFSVGTPVFTLPRNDPGGVIKANELGYTYTDENDLTVAFYKLISDPEKYNYLSNNCIKYMKSNHDLIKQSYEFLEIIKQ